MNTPTDSNPGWIDLAPGVRRRTQASGQAMMQMVVTFQAGSRLPEHRHPHEQVAFVVSGRLRFLLDGGQETREVGPGESIYLVSNRPHGAEALEDTVIADTFSPPREDLLEQDRALAAPSARV